MSHRRSGVGRADIDGGVRPVMRLLLCIAAALALSACMDGGKGRCTLAHTQATAFTSTTATDAITVRTFGEACDETVGLYEIRDAEGRPLWSWSAPLQREFGDVFASDEPDEMRAFLEQWAQPHIETTAAAPEWAQLAPGQTTLDQLTYADVRARNLPMLCHFSGTARQICVFWEPVAGAAGHFYDREVEESVE